MNPEKKSLIIRLMDFCKNAFDNGLIWGNSGNLSHRLNENTFIITGSGAHLGKLKNEDFVTVNLEDDRTEGDFKPSIETRMHSEIYRGDKNVMAVFHSQPFFTTLISCSDSEVDTKLIPESMAYLKKVGRIPYDHPGSAELAKRVSRSIKECDALILSNHGAICTGESLDEVRLKTETLEFLCRLIVISKIADIKLNYLSPSVKDDFLRHLERKK
ncbi:MAG: class II aldolase/adducin family protein [Methanomassiliicoccales archaeon]|nr:MAG: class II aldolase/adducin family protein [Methanomassiliicoccales archaeon]